MFRYLKIASCFLSIFLIGCVTPTPNFAGLKFEPSYSTDFDYKVTIENTIGGSFDRSQKEERLKMEETSINSKVIDPRLLEEIVERSQESNLSSISISDKSLLSRYPN